MGVVQCPPAVGGAEPGKLSPAPAVTRLPGRNRRVVAWVRLFLSEDRWRPASGRPLPGGLRLAVCVWPVPVWRFPVVPSVPVAAAVPRRRPPCRAGNRVNVTSTRMGPGQCDNDPVGKGRGAGAGEVQGTAETEVPPAGAHWRGGDGDACRGCSLETSHTLVASRGSGRTGIPARRSAPRVTPATARLTVDQNPRDSAECQM